MESIALLSVYLKSGAIKHSFRNFEPFLNIEDQDGIYFYRVIIILKMMMILYMVETNFSKYAKWLIFAITNAFIVYKYSLIAMLFLYFQCYFLFIASKSFTLFLSMALFCILSINIKCCEFILDVYTVFCLAILACQTYCNELQKLSTVVFNKLFIIWYICNLHIFSLKHLSLITCFLFLTYIPLKPNTRSKYKHALLYLYSLMVIWILYKFHSTNVHEIQTIIGNFKCFNNWRYYKSSPVSENADKNELFEIVPYSEMTNVYKGKIIEKFSFDNSSSLNKFRENMCRNNDETVKRTDIRNENEEEYYLKDKIFVKADKVRSNKWINLQNYFDVQKGTHLNVKKLNEKEFSKVKILKPYSAENEYSYFENLPPNIDVQNNFMLNRKDHVEIEDSFRFSKSQIFSKAEKFTGKSDAARNMMEEKFEQEIASSKFPILDNKLLYEDYNYEVEKLIDDGKTEESRKESRDVAKQSVSETVNNKHVKESVINDLLQQYRKIVKKYENTAGAKEDEENKDLSSMSTKYGEDGKKSLKLDGKYMQHILDSIPKKESKNKQAIKSVPYLKEIEEALEIDEEIFDDSLIFSKRKGDQNLKDDKQEIGYEKSKFKKPFRSFKSRKNDFVSENIIKETKKDNELDMKENTFKDTELKSNVKLNEITEKTNVEESRSLEQQNFVERNKLEVLTSTNYKMDEKFLSRRIFDPIFQKESKNIQAIKSVPVYAKENEKILEIDEEGFEYKPKEKSGKLKSFSKRIDDQNTRNEEKEMRYEEVVFKKPLRSFMGRVNEFYPEGVIQKIQKEKTVEFGMSDNPSEITKLKINQKVDDSREQFQGEHNILKKYEQPERNLEKNQIESNMVDEFNIKKAPGADIYTLDGLLKIIQNPIFYGQEKHKYIENTKFTRSAENFKHNLEQYQKSIASLLYKESDLINFSKDNIKRTEFNRNKYVKTSKKLFAKRNLNL